MDIKLILAVAIDDKGGIAFNKRPCSRDACLLKRLEDISVGNILYPTPDVSECRDLIGRLDEGKYVFFFNREDPSPVINLFDEVRIYQWNREYPNDVKFHWNGDGFHLVGKFDFNGKSHEKITELIYAKNEKEDSAWIL